MSTKNVKKVPEPKQKKYHFFDFHYDLYEENVTEQEFIEQVRTGGYSEDSVFFRIPVELFEKIQVKSQIVKA